MSETARTRTGIAGLDEMLRGGFLPGSMINVRGAPGTGKTSLAFQFLLEGARVGEAGLYITFEEFPEALYRDAASLGLDLQAAEKSGKLMVIFTSPEVLIESLADPDSTISQAILEKSICRAAIDSMSHFKRITEDEYALRNTFGTVINSLKREHITTLLLSEEQRSQYRYTALGGLSYLCDGIILLRYVEVESAIQRAIVILKLRGSDHAREIRHYRIQEGGLVIGEVFERRGAILSGISRRD